MQCKQLKAAARGEQLPAVRTGGRVVDVLQQTVQVQTTSLGVVVAAGREATANALETSVERHYAPTKEGSTPEQHACALMHPPPKISQPIHVHHNRFTQDNE